MHVLPYMPYIDDAVAAGPTVVQREIGVTHRQVVSLVDGGPQATRYTPAELHVYVCHRCSPVGIDESNI